MPIETCPTRGLQYILTERIVETEPSIKSKRKSVATAKRIEEIIAAGQRRGLTVAKVVQLPDGTCEVHFGADKTTMKRNPLEWDI
ncbi:MAG: hypothetical protein C0427_02465 [Rhodobacter sp.]|nr:hypothetical protein [Rhodobacter sp.]